MIRKLLGTALAFALIAGCAEEAVRPEQRVRIGDPSGYVAAVGIKPKDLTTVCSFEAFENGFRSTYMSMWNSKIDNLLEAKPTKDVAAYYTGRYFNSGPNVRATLGEDQRKSEGHDSCQESSYQQGRIRGFLYALEDLKALEEGAPR